MQKRRLGAQGLTVSAIGLGCMGMSEFYGTADRIAEIAKEKGITPGQLALAWVLAQGDDIVPIPGTKRRKYLEENVAAAEVTLSEEDLKRIDEVAPQGAAAGTRYPEAMMKFVDL